MVRLTKIYTRGGDAGQTTLGNRTRTAKNSPRVEAYGTVDETNATIGLARLYADAEIDAILARIQHDLFDLGADLCDPDMDSTRRLRMVQTQVDRLEAEIDQINAGLAPLNSFTLPGGTPCAAHLHLARTVSRRAERLAVGLAQVEEVNPIALRYLNRLSDLLYVLSRHANERGAKDVLWTPGVNR